ncbi:unnamed protein product [Cyprideis torosa]|uniref:Uncharacterized protein n=1 Tax=Cyprideis torosa TaxID=163714 RepID=A0A7R8WTA0_9CRUS|nr:unnamed protein product [Cyprideis torosa]CAG0908301.1 unnamed protein product [Cyprideis torosa]
MQRAGRRSMVLSIFRINLRSRSRVRSSSANSSSCVARSAGSEKLLARGVPDDAVVLVHDAARPCLSPQDLNLLLAASDSCADSGVILATPVRDTMKRARPEQSPAQIERTESREYLWHALTPQLARLSVLHQALSKGLADNAQITDEASALEYIGLQPRLLEGQASNIKITRPADLELAEFFLRQRLNEEEG